MDARDLKVGTKIELELISDSTQETIYRYTSQILDIIDESDIVIAYPIHETRLLFIPLNSKVSVEIIDGRYGLLYFSGIIKDKLNKDNIPTLHLVIEGEVERTQRREFFRVECNLDVNYRILDAKHEYRKALTNDLSGSGICITTDHHIPEGTYAEVVIFLDRQTDVKTLCSVIRSTGIENERGQKFKIGMSFAEIPKNGRDLIIKYIFDRQRNLIKKDVMKRDFTR